MSLKKEFVKVSFPTDLVWGIATLNGTTKPHTAGEVVTLSETMYPGINFWHTQLNTVAKEVISPDLKALFPKLSEAKTEDEAVKAFGEKIEISKVKNCKGYQWENTTWRNKLPGAKPA